MSGLKSPHDGNLTLASNPNLAIRNVGYPTSDLGVQHRNRGEAQSPDGGGAVCARNCTRDPKAEPP